MRLNRRKFLQVSAGVATAMALTSKKVGAQLKPVVKVGNPLESYPDRRSITRSCRHCLFLPLSPGLAPCTRETAERLKPELK